ncbi:MAG: hypothetical protein R3E83_02230 [Burkholderiaceae bacterium]
MANRDDYEGFVRGIILSGQATGLFRKDIDARLATIAVFSLHAACISGTGPTARSPPSRWPRASNR